MVVGVEVIEIGEAVLRLSIARGAGVTDDITSDVYVRGLSDLDAGLVRRACESLGREPRQDFEPALPPVPVIRDRVARIRRQDATVADARALPPRPDEQMYRCYRCQDDPGGWLVPMSCPVVRCERREDHPPHPFTSRCPCWLERNAERLMLRREKAIQDNKPISLECELLDDLRAGRYRYARPQ